MGYEKDKKKEEKKEEGSTAGNAIRAGGKAVTSVTRKIEDNVIEGAARVADSASSVLDRHARTVGAVGDYLIRTTPAQAARDAVRGITGGADRVARGVGAAGDYLISTPASQVATDFFDKLTGGKKKK